MAVTSLCAHNIAPGGKCQPRHGSRHADAGRHER